VPDFSYSAFGLNLVSDLQFPELNPAFPGDGVRIRLAPSLDSSQLSSVSCDGNGTTFDLEGIARYSVSGGREILVSPYAGADPAAIRLFLLSTAMGAMLQQRRTVALHASAVATSHGAVVCAGPSGSGKSTLAACLFQRGFPVLTDEIAALQFQGETFVLPGSAALMLWKDALAKLGMGSVDLRPVRIELQKYFLPVDSLYQSQPVRLRKIYLLEAGPAEQLSLLPLRGWEKFQALASILYRPRLIEDPGIESDLAIVLAKVASQIDIARLYRPRLRFCPKEIADLIERDLD
jgi:hypothetical protein